MASEAADGQQQPTAQNAAGPADADRSDDDDAHGMLDRDEFVALGRCDSCVRCCSRRLHVLKHHISSARITSLCASKGDARLPAQELCSDRKLLVCTPVLSGACAHNIGLPAPLLQSQCYSNTPARPFMRERLFFCSVAYAMLQYEHAGAAAVSGWRTQLRNVPAHHLALLPHVPAHCERAEVAVRANSDFLRAVVQDAEAGGAIGPALTAAASHERRTGGHVDGVNAGKVRASVNSLMMLGSSAPDCSV
jgi:hypothetical protein